MTRKISHNVPGAAAIDIIVKQGNYQQFLCEKMNKPLMIIVSGRPGSGKTTITRELARELRCPIVSRDELKEGYIHTAKKEHREITDEEIRGINSCFFEAIELLADHKIAVIAESAFQHKMWTAKYDVLSKKAALKVIICKTDKTTANKRFLKRRAEDPLREYFHGDSVINSADDNYEYEPPRFPVPLLEVDTTGAYKPCLDEIVAFVKEQARP